MRRLRRVPHGMALIEYAVLVGAIILGVSVAAHMAYESYVKDAEVIEVDGVVF